MSFLVWKMRPFSLTITPAFPGDSNSIVRPLTYTNYSAIINIFYLLSLPWFSAINHRCVHTSRFAAIS